MTRRGLLLHAAQAVAAKRPNVLLLVLDHVRACDLGCYGDGVNVLNVPTPNLDRLAAEGTRFANALSTCPLSTPFRAMLQTGLPPLRTGAIVNGLDVPARGRTLAASFADAGYTTAYIGKWHLAAGRLRRAANSEIERKQPEYVPPGPARMGYEAWYAYNFHTEFARGYFYRDTPRRLLMPGYETDAEIVMANEVMHECRMSNRPFFLVVSPHPPHPPWKESHVPAGALDKVAASLTWRPNVPSAAVAQPPGDPRCYFAQLANVDENLGKMLAYLDKNELANDTIVAVVSAQGEMLGGHGLWGAAAPYEEAVRVPLLIRLPNRVPAKSVDDSIVVPTDLFPMLSSLAGIAPQAPRKKRQAALLMNFTGSPERAVAGGEWRAVRDLSHTYVRWRTGETALFDNVKDPFQLRNLGPSKVHERRLRDLLKEAADPFASGESFESSVAAMR